MWCAATVTVRLGNGGPVGGHGLPDYVAGRVDGLKGRGSNHTLLSLFATRGAELVGAEVDGKQALVAVQAEHGRPVFTADVEIPAQKSITVTFRLVEPTAAGAAVVRRQPLVRPVSVVADVPQCT
jgi:hypothetical protein